MRVHAAAAATTQCERDSLRQFMRGELLRPRTYCPRTLTIRIPCLRFPVALRISRIFPPPPPSSSSSSSLSPGWFRSVFVLIIIHRATTVAQRLLLADYTSRRSRNRSIVCSLKRCFRPYRIACAYAWACTSRVIRNNPPLLSPRRQ